MIADPWGFNGSNGHHSSTSTVDGFELAEAEAALDLESEDEIDAAARLAALTGDAGVVEPAGRRGDLRAVGSRATDRGRCRGRAEPVVVEPIAAEPVVAEPVAAEPVVVPS